MKKLLLLLALLCAPFVPAALQAQSATDDYAMRQFARDFMAAYNRQDVPALQAMFTKDAVSVADGSVTEGAEKIAQLFTDRFIREDVTLLVRQMALNWSDAQHAWVAGGTYEGFGVTYVYDIPFRQKSAYKNTMIEENGQWKIARSVVTRIVKTMVYQKNVQPGTWKSALTGALEGSGVLSMDTSSVQGNAKSVYALLEWPSLEVAHAFFTNPDWSKSLPKTAKGEKPTVVYLEMN